MAHQMDKNVQVEIRSMPGNTICCDCNTKNPQWASVSYGSLFCLECSGVHRSLGVHISFVRSITMDSWSDKQIQMMRLGGNQKLQSWFEKHNLPKNTPIKEKYNHPAAELYRERLKAMYEGRELPTELPKREPAKPRQEYKSMNSYGNGSGANYVAHGNTGFGTPAPTNNDMFDPDNLRATGDAALESLSSAFSSLGSLTASAAGRVREAGLSDKLKDTISDPNLVNNLKETTEQTWSSFATGASSLFKKISFGVQQDQQPGTTQGFGNEGDSTQGFGNAGAAARGFGADSSNSSQPDTSRSAIRGFGDDISPRPSTAPSQPVEDDDEWLRKSLEGGSTRPAASSPVNTLPAASQQTIVREEPLAIAAKAPPKPPPASPKKEHNPDDFFAEFGVN